MTDSQRIRDLEDALRPFAELEYDSSVASAWEMNRKVNLSSGFHMSKSKLDPADVKRAARVLRGR